MLEQNIAPIVDRLNIAKRVLLEKKGFFCNFFTFISEMDGSWCQCFTRFIK